MMKKWSGALMVVGLCGASAAHGYAQDASFVCEDSGARSEEYFWSYPAWVYRALDPSEANPTDMVGIPPVSTPVPAATLLPNERRIVLFGDLMATEHEELPRVDPKLRALFGSADLVVGNMEAPVYRGALDQAASQWFDFHASTGFVESFFAQFCVDPERMVFTVANNHAADKGRWPETLRALVPAAEYTPAQANTAPKPLKVRGVVGRPVPTPEAVDVYDLGGVRVGVVGWTEIENCAPADDWYETCGVWRTDEQVYGVDWNRVKRERDIHVLIGVPHWDRQFYYFPQAGTQIRARVLLTAGFDLIAGADPHVLQPAQNLPTGMVFHSLGGLNVNFGWLSGTSLVVALEVIVSAQGDVLRYKLHPYAQRRAPAGTSLSSSSACLLKGVARTMPDVGRPTASEIVSLDQVSNAWGVRSDLEDEVELVFPAH